MWSAVTAGILAGFGVAMPMGAVAALLLREGLVNGFGVAAAAASGVAAVDVVYCTVATVTGTALVRAIDAHRGVILSASGVLIIAIGLWQLRGVTVRRSRAPVQVQDLSAFRAFVRFVGLTAINPVTLVYFAALAATASSADGSPAASVAFVVAVGCASLTWQVLLAGIGSLFGAAVSPRIVATIGTVASLVIVGLGITVLANGIHVGR